MVKSLLLESKIKSFCRWIFSGWRLSEYSFSKRNGVSSYCTLWFLGIKVIVPNFSVIKWEISFLSIFSYISIGKPDIVKSISLGFFSISKIKSLIPPPTKKRFSVLHFFWRYFWCMSSLLNQSKFSIFSYI